MDLVISISLLLAGFTILIFAGDALVKAAVSISARTKIDPATIGLTVIAAGTSAPELVTSLLAAFKNSPDIALGNVVGSNIFNILAIIGIASFIKPNKISTQSLRIELPFLIFSAIFLFILGQDLNFSRIDGSIMLLVLGLFLVYTIRAAKKRGIDTDLEEEIEILKSPFYDGLYLVVGFVGLIGGADLALRGGVQIGEYIGLSERIIGITIISVGTGLPELVTSAVAAYKGRDDIAISNVIGSNIMNTLAIIGTTSLVLPIRASEQIMNFDVYWMIAASAILLPLFYMTKRVSNRPTAGLLLGIYLTYITILIVN